MSNKVRIALIHALAHSVAPINEALAREWPETIRMNLLDDSMSADLASGGRGLDAAMHERFMRLGQYAADCGSDAMLFTCSAFGPCVEAVARRHAPMPVLKPNEAMIEEAVQSGKRVGLVATFAPTLASMPLEFPVTAQPVCRLAEGALEALHAGDAARHDELIVQAAQWLKAQECELVALAQFSIARAKGLVEQRTGLVVLTTVDSVVRSLGKCLSGIRPLLAYTVTVTTAIIRRSTSG
jgi:Asp/Glu/hydantoin racemase